MAIQRRELFTAAIDSGKGVETNRKTRVGEGCP